MEGSLSIRDIKLEEGVGSGDLKLPEHLEEEIIHISRSQSASGIVDSNCKRLDEYTDIERTKSSPRVVEGGDITNISRTKSSTSVTGRTILVGVDKRPSSRNAFAWAVGNFLRPNDRIILATSSKEMLSKKERRPSFFQRLASGVRSGLTSSQESTPHVKADTLLHKYASFCELYQISFTVRLIRGQNPGAELLKIAKEELVSAIIVGSSNRSATDRLLLGSTSEYVALNAFCPVVLVKQEHKLALKEKERRRIGVAVSSSKHSLAAFYWTLESMARAGDTVFLIHVNYKEFQQSAEDQLMRELAAACRDRNLPYQRVDGRCSASNAGPYLAELVQGAELDVLVVGNRTHRGAMQRHLFGSVSNTTIRTAPADVVVVKRLPRFERLVEAHARRHKNSGDWTADLVEEGEVEGEAGGEGDGEGSESAEGAGAGAGARPADGELVQQQPAQIKAEYEITG